MISQSKFTSDLEELCLLGRAFDKCQWTMRKVARIQEQNSPVWAIHSEFVLVDQPTPKKYKRVSSLCYSEVYNVPVFWFNFYDIDGKLLLYEQFRHFAFVRNESGSELAECVTQGEHPFLGIAFYNVHPCKTAELMKSVETRNYVLSFLSTLGSIFLYNLPVEFFAAGLVGRAKDQESGEIGVNSNANGEGTIKEKPPSRRSTAAEEEEEEQRR